MKIDSVGGKFPAGNLFLILSISVGVIKAAKGIADGDGKMVAKAVLGTAAGIGGGVGGAILGAEIGTLICPGAGTIIGGAVGSIVIGISSQLLVEDVIIENI